MPLPYCVWSHGIWSGESPSCSYEKLFNRAHFRIRLRFSNVLLEPWWELRWLYRWSLGKVDVTAVSAHPFLGHPYFFTYLSSFWNFYVFIVAFRYSVPTWPLLSVLRYRTSARLVFRGFSRLIVQSFACHFDVVVGGGEQGSPTPPSRPEPSFGTFNRAPRISTWRFCAFFLGLNLRSFVSLFLKNHQRMKFHSFAGTHFKA